MNQLQATDIVDPKWWEKHCAHCSKVFRKRQCGSNKVDRYKIKHEIGKYMCMSCYNAQRKKQIVILTPKKTPKKTSNPSTPNPKKKMRIVSSPFKTHSPRGSWAVSVHCNGD